MTRFRSRIPLVSLALAIVVSLLLPANALATKAKVNLNSATQQELEALPGVGEATAKEDHRRPTLLFRRRPGQSRCAQASTIDKIRSQVTAKPAAAAKAPTKTAKSNDRRKTASPRLRRASPPRPKKPRRRRRPKNPRRPRPPRRRRAAPST